MHGVSGISIYNTERGQMTSHKTMESDWILCFSLSVDASICSC